MIHNVRSGRDQSRPLYLVASVVLAVPVCWLVACGDDAKLYESVGSETCKSEKKWAAGDNGSPKMHPGRNCVECHSENAGAPKFSIAGTVYAGYEEPNDCAGVQGAEVVVTDSNGEKVQLETNESGNFYLRARKTNLSKPYRAKVRYEGETRKMKDELFKLNCSNCHTATRQGQRKPGRIVIPGVEAD